MRGQLWVIDGADGVGKATQVELLVKRLNSSAALGGHKAHHISFPHYQEKPWGVLIRQHLDGVFGPLEATGPYAASVLFAGDRGQHAQEMHKILESGDWIICDRYVSSNAAFQAAKIKNEDEKQRYINWLFDTEFNLFGVPKPDGVVVLTLPVHISHKRTESRREQAVLAGQDLSDKIGHQDIYEQNKDYMSAAMQEYVKMAKQYSWHIVECTDGDKELSREEVSQKIWNIIDSQIKKRPR